MRHTTGKPLGDYPRLFPTPEQTITGIGETLRDGKTTCLEILESCLAQVDDWEPKVHAWVVLDRERAIEQARVRDDELKKGNDRGPLHGIPIGIKDIIDVAGLPTACGSKRWANQVADTDADVVANLRKAGAVIMGKTVTTPYAWIDPPTTRNPWNLDRTPGGSSSGSAAAVACGMCFGAIGTQTGGSITRPASFCGVAGMKPNKLMVMNLMSGIKPFARSLDHVGPIARTVVDLRALFDGMHEDDFMKKTDQEIVYSSQSQLRFGRPRGYFDDRAEPTVKSAFEKTVRDLVARGASVVDMDDPVNFEQILVDHRRIMASEAAAVHSDWWDEFPEDYPARIQELILEGRSVKAVGYLQAADRQRSIGIKLWQALKVQELDSLITPATVSTAPDPLTTGDPAFNSPWSFLGVPTVSFPTGLASDGLPVALQIVGWSLGDYRLLRIAEWCEQAIRNSRL
jgi:Asp-tRNA(Asn)/Glu-tRNA(Gln) amidotransferase A subunit family amidase